MASAVTRIAGEIYQVMQKMQGLHRNGWVGGWVSWGGGRGTDVRGWRGSDEHLSKKGAADEKISIHKVQSWDMSGY